jgi:voltage-gated potassium channel
MSKKSSKRHLRSSFKKILIGAAFFAITQLVAVIGYMLAGWSFLDALYMVVITTFGVGYGEVKPIISPALRVFTMLVIVAGTSSVVYLVGGFVQMITEGEIKRVLGARRVSREIMQLNQHVIICGYGRIGQTLVEEIATSNLPFIVIDNNEERIAQAESAGHLVMLGSATDEQTLMAAGIDRARTLATALPDDAFNVFITLTARGLNPNLTIIARGELPSTEKKLLQAGADRVVSPATIGAHRMAHLITHPAALDFFEQSDGRLDLNELLAELDLHMEELVISHGSPLVGYSISSVEVNGKGAFIVVALRRANGETIINPGSEVFLHEDDTLILMGHRGDIPKFAKHYALRQQLQYRGMRQR